MTTSMIKARPAAVHIIAVMLTVVLVISLSFVINPVMADVQVKVGTVKNLKAVSGGSTSLKLKWGKNINAKGYIVYRYDKEKGKYRKRADIKGADNTSYTDKYLTSGQVYKYKVRAYTKKNGERHYGSASYWIKARPYPAGSKNVNASKIKFEDGRFDLGFLDKVKARAYVKAVKSGKAKGKKPVDKAVRWYSSNTKIATVNKNGGIATKKKTGTCYIYAVAHNGIKGKIKVTVHDYAHPSYFDVTDVSGDAHTLLTAYKDEISEIAGYYHLHRPEKEEMILLNDDVVLVEPDEDYDLGSIRGAVDRVLRGIPDENLMINVTKRFLTFSITEITGEDENRDDIGYFHQIKYYYNKDLYDWDPDLYDFDDIAPHWGYSVRDIRDGTIQFGFALR